MNTFRQTFARSNVSLAPIRPLDFVDLMVVDDIVPSDFSPFRTIEYEHYLTFFNSALLSLEGWHTWIGNGNFNDLLELFPIDVNLKPRIVRFRSHANIIARLAYVTFLGNAARLLSYFESRRIPFILQLYPGGGFEIDRPETDEKLRRVLLSDLCRKVIVTQRITESYLIDKIGCDPAKIEHIFGGVFESRTAFNFDRDKTFYPKDKDTIDLCFVAHKYAGNITSKGYDQFVAIALELAGKFAQLRFHIVGDYLPEDVDLGGYVSRFTFYGRRSSAFLLKFYRSMDAIISVNRPFDLTPGSFDGFPTGACIEAGLNGVLNCINDPLVLNPCFIDGDDIILLNLDYQRSASRLFDLVENPSELYRIAEAGRRRFHEIFDTDRQLWARTRIIAAELMRHEGLIIRPAADPSVLDLGQFERLLVPYRERIAVLEAEAHPAVSPYTEPRQAQLVVLPDQPNDAASECENIDINTTDSLAISSSGLANEIKSIYQVHDPALQRSRRIRPALRYVRDGYRNIARRARKRTRRARRLLWWTLTLPFASRLQLFATDEGKLARPQTTLRQPLRPDELTAENKALNGPE